VILEQRKGGYWYGTTGNYLEVKSPRRNHRSHEKEIFFPSSSRKAARQSGWILPFPSADVRLARFPVWKRSR
jgi:hypothetical protein